MDNSHIQWAINILYENGYQIYSVTPEIIQDNPWSIVCRFETDKGFIFLKKVPKALSLEPKIINILFNEYNANVPFIIGENLEQHCFLMRDAGIALHGYLKLDFCADIFIQMMNEYTKLQVTISNKIQPFLELGVPDWRLEKLPDLYQYLIDQKGLLLDDGLTQEELKKLKNLEQKFISICKQLSNYNIKDTFGHADFHDKNVLIDINSKKTTLIDLGEVVITHPFFSFLNCIYRVKGNFLLSDKPYQELQIACLKPWLELETQDRLFEILSLIQQCWSIHSALGEFRLIKSIDEHAFQILRRQGRLSRYLRHWLATSN